MILVFWHGDSQFIFPKLFSILQSHYNSMFRPMRRIKQQLSESETISLLEKGTSGVLALLGDEGYPYSLPMSYAFDGSRFIFHSALSGHKIDAIKNNNKASFCIVEKDEVIPDEYTTYFRSVIAFGKIRILSRDEARDAAKILGAKYRPGFEEELAATVERNLDKMCVFVLEIEHMTGKEAIELVRAKKQ